MIEGKVHYHFLIPSKTQLKKGESLNVLVGVAYKDEEPIYHEFVFYGDDGTGVKKIYSETRIIESGGNPHFYFNIPAECFTAEFWGEDPEEIFIYISDTSPDKHTDGSMIFIY
ncbi:MAG: hypothetical protein E7218_00770 [Anaerofustis stercorihominis]|nr:hypothetical protein [Anaerofustis stercorihominis]